MLLRTRLGLISLGLMLFLIHGRAPAPRAALAQNPGATWYAYAPLVLRNHQPEPVTPPDGVPSWSAPIAISPRDGSVWVANPDAGSVSVVDAASLLKVAEVPTGQEPWALAVSPDGRTVYVVDRAGGTLVVVDAVTHQPRSRLPLGPEPIGVALNPTGLKAYVTLAAADQVVVLDTRALEIIARIPVAPHPYAIAVSDDGDLADVDEHIYVTHLSAFQQPGGQEATDTGRAGQVTTLEANTGAVVNRVMLAPDEQGFPNSLAGIALAGQRAWVPHVRAAPDLPNDLTTIVFAAVAEIDLRQGVENFDARLLLNDQDVFGSPVNDPLAAVPTPDGRTLYVVLAGSDLVEVVDVSQPAQPRLIKFLPTGKNPRGLALSPDGRRGYVMNYLSRSVSVFDLAALEPIAEVPVTAETLDPAVLYGKVLFNNATNPKLSQGGWVSCASCHPDGGTDGVTWMFPDGPRQSPPLWNATRTLPWHWSAALDEAQDVEVTVEDIQRGVGLAPGIDPPLLGQPNAGRSADLDALAAFLERGIRPPAPPSPDGDIAQGRAVFQAAGCAACHGGPAWTLSARPGPAGTLDPDGNGMVDGVLRNVGTFNPRDLRGATGFDPPSLLGVGLTAPYLHDGSQPTLEALLVSGHPDPQGSGNGLSPEERTLLIAFLRSIGPDTLPIDAQ